MTEAEQRIREALAAGPTPGPWSWWTSCSFRRLSSDATGKDGDVLHATIHRDGMGDIVGTEATKQFIAACTPENIAALLAEIDRLRAAVQHEADCVEAAKAEVEALRAALHTCLWAMRQPLDEWKGDCERKAMDIARAALAQAKEGE